MVPVIGIGIIISVFLIVVARPISVYISLSFFKEHNRNKYLISWVGLRGAVPIVFATYPLLSGAEKAQMIFNLVFFISLTSVLIQGTSLPLIAKILHLTLPEKVKHRTIADIELTTSIKSNLTKIIIPENGHAIGKQIVQLGLPKTSEIAIIQRDDKYITPDGSTYLEANDVLFVLSENPDSLKNVFNCLEIKND